jgi:hypothetical protein
MGYCLNEIKQANFDTVNKGLRRISGHKKG